MRKIPLRWVIFAIFAYVVLILFFYSVFIFPQKLAIKNLKEELLWKSSYHRVMEPQEISFLREELKRTVYSFEKRLLPGEEYLLANLGKTAEKSKVEIISIIPSSPEEGKSCLKLPARVTFSGNYQGIRDFVNLLENGKTFFLIEKLSLNSGEFTHQAEMDLITYLKKLEVKSE